MTRLNEKERTAVKEHIDEARTVIKRKILFVGTSFSEKNLRFKEKNENCVFSSNALRHQS